MGNTLSAFTLALLALSAGLALAQDPSGPKTRAQVRAELEEAKRTGNMLANDETGRMLNEINPSAYPPKVVAPCKTREQVRAELDEAKRTGNMPAPDEIGCMLRDMYPDLYPKR
jgi:Domain of unknown function (DUF4148)